MEFEATAVRAGGASRCRAGLPSTGERGRCGTWRAVRGAAADALKCLYPGQELVSIMGFSDEPIELPLQNQRTATFLAGKLIFNDAGFAPKVFGQFAFKLFPGHVTPSWRLNSD